MDYRTLHTKTVADLRMLAKQNGVKIPAGAPKMRIIEFILEAERNNAARAAVADAPADSAQAAPDSGATDAVAPEVVANAQAPAPSTDTSAPAAQAAPAVENRPRRGRPPGTGKKQKALAAQAAEKSAEPASEAPASAAPVMQNKRRPGRPPRKPDAQTPSAAPEATVLASADKPNTPESARVTEAAPDTQNIAPDTSIQIETGAQATPEAPIEAPAANNAEANGDADSEKAPAETADAPDAGRYAPRAQPRNYVYARTAAPRADIRSRTLNGQDGAYTQRAPMQPRMYPRADGNAPVQPRTLPRAEGGMPMQPRTLPRAEGGLPVQPRVYPRAEGAPRALNRAEYAPMPPARSVTQPGEADAPASPTDAQIRREYQDAPASSVSEILASSDCPDGAGVLEIHPDGYGFLRAENYLPGAKDVYVSIAQIRRFGLRTGDYVQGKTRAQRDGDRYVAMLYINSVNDRPPDEAFRRPKFEDLTPIYPDSRLHLEAAEGNTDLALRAIDMIAPIGKGQRGMIVSPPKAGKTVLLKKIANAVTANYPDVHLIVLLIDERPEEVTDLKRSIKGEVVYSTFDETPDNHTRLSEMTLEHAQRLVETGKDVVILMDSITRLARAYNLVIPPTGRSLSGGLDPGALHKPKRFFGAARNIENGGSLTIIATALVETGSRMDDIIYEEFKGTGNMELHLDRKLSEKRIFPAIDLAKSGTRRDELLLSEEEYEGALSVRRMLSASGGQDTTEQLIGLMEKTKCNGEFFTRMKGWAAVWQKEGFSFSGR